MPALQWLSDISAEEARGGFPDSSSLISYLRNAQYTTSELITKTCTLITAIAYRWLDYTISDDPDDLPETEDQKKLMETLKPLCDGRIVRHIGSTYPGREDKKDILTRETIDKDEYSENEVVKGRKRSLSTDSVIGDEGTHRDVESRPGRIMYKTTPGTHDESWPSEAFKDGVPIRNHISSGLPLDLAVCEGLMELAIEKPQQGSTNDSTWPKEKADEYSDLIRKVAAVMFIPHYCRADYHSWSESWAAVEHFIDCRIPGKKAVIWSPKELMRKTAESMLSAVDEKVRKNVQEKIKSMDI